MADLQHSPYLAAAVRPEAEVVFERLHRHYATLEAVALAHGSAGGCENLRALAYAAEERALAKIKGALVELGEALDHVTSGPTADEAEIKHALACIRDHVGDLVAPVTEDLAERGDELASVDRRRWGA